MDDFRVLITYREFLKFQELLKKETNPKLDKNEHKDDSIETQDQLVNTGAGVSEGEHSANVTASCIPLPDPVYEDTPKEISNEVENDSGWNFANKISYSEIPNHTNSVQHNELTDEVILQGIWQKFRSSASHILNILRAIQTSNLMQEAKLCT